MVKLVIKSDPKVHEKFSNYPEKVKPKLSALRNLIIEVANQNDAINELVETLKWGEPSYIAKKGSTIRIDWKAKSPNQYAMYFNCSTILVATFRELFGAALTYEKNRAIVFGINDSLPKEELKICINMALGYHTLKNMPLLGQ